MSVIKTQPLIGSSGNQGGYKIERSLRFRNSASAYLSRTPSSTTNQKTWTWSAWVKRGTLGAVMPLFNANGSSPVGTQFGCVFASSDKIQFYTDNSSSSNFVTTQVFRDPSAWYHIVIAFDTTQATNTNRVKLYVNGSQITAFDTSSYPSQNLNTAINSNSLHNIGKPYDAYYFDGYMTEINFIDGQQLTPSSFGETDSVTGVWKPKKYTGSYGTNGFYLNFSDNSAATAAAIGKDSSGNGNNWTPNNISLTAGSTYDSMTDVPTLTSATAANYATLNPLVSAGSTLSNANLTTSGPTTGYSSVPATIGVTSGKWYWEVTAQSDPGVGVGIMTISQPVANYLGQTSGVGYFNSGNIYKDGVLAQTTTTYTTNDVVGAALDLNAGTLQFYKNNVAVGSSVSISYGTIVFPACGDGSAASNGVMSINFGQQGFKYTPPTGFVALNTFNLPTPAIPAGNKVMDATTYTGNGSTQTITNAGGFQPDLVWVKGRSGAYSNILQDSIRGAGKSLVSNSTAAETGNAADLISSFNSNGFSENTNLNGGTDGSTDANGQAYVGWQWQAGQGTTSSNTNGSITSTVSVNASAGFSIVTYTGTGANATVGHGLGVAPVFYIVKNRSAVTDWPVFTTATGTFQFLYLNTTAASATPAISAPTSTVLNLGTSSTSNGNGNSIVAYCWAPIAGFSQFGSYTGNGSTDGPFIYTGFRPKFLMIKRTDTTTNWVLVDSTRNTYNVFGSYLYPNLSNAEAGPATLLDFVSNGFKLRCDPAAYTAFNASGGTFIYAAFAENPFKYALAR